jgi:transposase-like protein
MDSASGLLWPPVKSTTGADGGRSSALLERFAEWPINGAQYFNHTPYQIGSLTPGGVCHPVTKLHGIKAMHIPRRVRARQPDHLAASCDKARQSERSPRLSVLYIPFHKGTPRSAQTCADRFRLIQPHLEQDRSLSSVAQTAGVSYRTAHRWVTQYRRFGFSALACKQRENRGGRRAVPTKLREIMEGLALRRPPLPIAALYRQVVHLAQKLGERAPSYGTVFNIVHSLGADLLLLGG